jgi:hypothetical protein
MHTQSLFNEDVVRLAETVYRDLRSVESASGATRVVLEQRIRRIEETLSRIEKSLAHSTRNEAEPFAPADRERN